MQHTQHGPALGRILLIRHGQTAGNKRRYVGWDDPPLDETGVAQAHAVAALLADERIDAVYASPLGRALATAQPLAACHGLPVQVRAELKEIDYGACQGLLKNERPLRLRQQHREVPLPNGESLLDVDRRIRRLIASLQGDLDAGRHLALVGHFWSNRLLVGALCGLPFEASLARSDYKPTNGSVFALNYAVDAQGRLLIHHTCWLTDKREAAQL